MALMIEALPPAALKPDNKLTDRDVVIKNLKLYVRGKEFFIKGLNYSPQPLGASQTPIGGMCSIKKTVYGQDVDACYFEDYFDGVESDNGGLAKPDGPWWKKVWERDMKVMSQELGANTIRVYHMESISKTLLDKYPKIYFPPKYIPQYAAVHKPFLDTAFKYGLKVIVPMVSEETILVNTPIEDLKRYIEARVDELGDHEALLMWKIGNELGLYNKPELRTTVNACIDYTREYMMKKWNRIIPITTAEIDLPTSYVTLANEMHIDVFTSNAGYRDIGLYTLWEPDPNNKFQGWTALSKETGLPLLIGEFGMHEQDKRTAQMPDWVNQQWKSMVEYKKSGCIGGLFFEFNEEPKKPVAQRDMGLVRFIPSFDSAQNKNSTDPGVFVPDAIERKPVVFDAIKQGLPSSNYKQYSFAGDVYTLTNTPQTSITVISTGPPPAIPSDPVPQPTVVVPGESSSPVHPSSPAHVSSSSSQPEPRPSSSISNSPGSRDSGSATSSSQSLILLIAVMVLATFTIVLNH